MKFFNAAAQADAKNFATPKRNQRVRQLVAFAHRILVAPRVEVGKNPLAPPFAEHHHQRECDHHDGRNDEKHPRIDAAQKQNSHGDDRDHHESAHVGFCQQQQTHNRNGERHRHDGAKEPLLDFHFSDHVVGGIQKHRELGQL